jgi:hypothetical protein
MIASAKFSLKFSIGLPGYCKTHEDLHCETVTLDNCGMLTKLIPPQPLPIAERLFPKPVHLMGPLLASRLGRNL